MSITRRLDPAFIAQVRALVTLTVQHPNTEPPTRADAFPFLNQATFRPAATDIDRRVALRAYDLRSNRESPAR